MHLKSVVEFLKHVDELTTAENLLDTFSKYAIALEQFDELGMLYEKIKAYQKSLLMLEKCMEFTTNQQQLLSIYANLSKVYNHVNDPERSLFYSARLLEVNPNDYEAKMEQSFSHYLNGDSQASYQIQKQILEVPNVPEQLKNRIVFNMGSFELEQGKFKSGLKKFILDGRKINIHPEIKKPYMRWRGEPTDKTVLVYAEAGIGDEIMCVRFMHTLKERGFKAIWIGHNPDTTDLFQRNGIETAYSDKQFIKIDQYVYTESMSLAVLLEVEEKDLWHGPYLTANQSFVDKWKSRLPEKFITVRWSGNPYYDQDLHRTVDRDVLINTLLQYNIPIVSLQIDNKSVDNKLIDVDIKTWEDTLAIQYLAQLNITSCTSTAHSASASNANCVVLPPIATYYSWLNLKPDNTSHWYGKNTVIFPQTVHKDWSGPLLQLRTHMDKIMV